MTEPATADCTHDLASPAESFSRPLAEVEERWLSSLDDDDVFELCERLSKAVGRPLDTPQETLAVQVVSGLYAIGELGPGLLTAESLEAVLLGVMPRHAIVSPREAAALLEDVSAAVPFFVEEEILAAANEEAVRLFLTEEGLADRLSEALGNFDLFDDEKFELLSEEAEREAMANAARKAVKAKQAAKKKAKSKAAKAARRKQRR